MGFVDQPVNWPPPSGMMLFTADGAYWMAGTDWIAVRKSFTLNDLIASLADNNLSYIVEEENPTNSADPIYANEQLPKSLHRILVYWMHKGSSFS